MTERMEALLRIPFGLLSGFILYAWAIAVKVAAVIHFIIVLIDGKRKRAFADFCNQWTAFAYQYVRYMTFSTNNRPFPFGKLPKPLEKYDKK